MPDFFEAVALDDGSKEQLCRDLLAEFGVTNVNATSTGELIHSCCLPFGRHKNGDRNPSASLNFRKLTYNCLGCGSSGGLLWLIAVLRGGSTEEAREWLNGQTGLGNTVLELGTLLQILDGLYAGNTNVRPPIPRYDRKMLDPWLWEIYHPYLTDGMPGVLEGRHIPESTLDHFTIGYADEYTDGSERIIIPLFWKGDLVGWQARHVVDLGQSDKYRNSPDFPRDRTIYNFDNGDRHSAIVVESPMSVLRHFHHQPTMQATFGAKVTDDQIKLLQRYDRVVLWMDNDKAGWTATHRVAEELARYNTVWVVESPFSADAADLDDAGVDQLIAGAVPYSIWRQPTELIPWEG